MRKILFVLFVAISTLGFAQIDKLNPKQPLVKDPYFKKETNVAVVPGQKVEFKHSDTFNRNPELYGGNPYFDGNVVFIHNGATLTADRVIFYEKDNFAKAIGNVVLLTPDGNRITAEEMEYDGNTERGIARKNVVLTDPKQTISTQVLYYDRLKNTAYFNTGGTIYDGKNTMWTQAATYFVDTKTNDFTGNYTIDNDQYRVEGKNIKHYQNTNTADFFGPTTITNKKKPSNYVYTENGRYLMNEKEVYLNKNSRIYYNGKILKGDKMYYNQLTGFGKAEGNVRLDDPKEKRYIIGGYGEIYEKTDSAMMTKKPYAVKLFKEDTAFIAAEKFLSYQKLDSTKKKKSFLRGYKKVRLYMKKAQGRADSLSFNETDGVLHLNIKPLFWSGEKQISGEKIEAYFNTENENIDSLKVIGNAFAISKADSLNLKDEFNQVKGKLMTVYYENNEVKIAKVIGNAQAITYADSEDAKTKKLDRVGVALSTCGQIEALFEDKKIQIISCNIGANTDIYPMSKIAPEKRKFPDFNWNTKDRPRKWEDIFLDTPEYEETKYETDDILYKKAEELRKKEEEKRKPKTPKRDRKL
mgnify:FL=1